MQNKYFGDIHDFYKYFLLKNISEYKSLGIHWCLAPDDERSDGNKPLTEIEKINADNYMKLLNKVKI
jgi:hypothetical protein